jgi:hypothetical protein
MPARWWREVGLVVGVDALYESVRSLAPARVATALANARGIEGLERILHLDVEAWLNRGLEQASWLVPPVSVYYQVGHLLALLATLGWAWRRHLGGYAAARTALVGLSLTALAGYWLAPTAPPRLALSGVVDTVAAHPVLFAGNDSVTGMVNLFAAMPSLHVAWSVWVALTVSSLSGHRLRRLAWLHPFATSVVVLATANHYVVDAVAGAALALAAWMLSQATGRRSLRRTARSQLPGPQLTPPIRRDQRPTEGARASCRS